MLVSSEMSKTRFEVRVCAHALLVTNRKPMTLIQPLFILVCKLARICPPGNYSNMGALANEGDQVGVAHGNALSVSHRIMGGP